MKFTFPILAVAVLGLLFSCSPSSRGKSAGKNYCNCEKKDGFIEIAKCKKDILSDNKKNFENKEFDKAFWDVINNCD
jgi:hypothetical protein